MERQFCLSICMFPTGLQLRAFVTCGATVAGFQDRPPKTAARLAGSDPPTAPTPPRGGPGRPALACRRDPRGAWDPEAFVKEQHVQNRVRGRPLSRRGCVWCVALRGVEGGTHLHRRKARLIQRPARLAAACPLCCCSGAPCGVTLNFGEPPPHPGVICISRLNRVQFCQRFSECLGLVAQGHIRVPILGRFGHSSWQSPVLQCVFFLPLRSVGRGHPGGNQKPGAEL